MSDQGVPHSNPRKGFLLALASIILLAVSLVSTKYALREINPETLSLVWTTSAAVFAFLFLLLRGFGRELRIPGRLVVPVLVLGLATGGGIIMNFASLHLLDPTFNAFLWRFWPVVSIILSLLFLGEKLSARELPPMAVMLFGAMISTYGQWTIVGKGVILVSVAVLFAAAQALIAKVLIPDIHPRVLIIYRNGLGAVCLAAWVLPIGRFDLSAAHLDTWVVILVAVILGPWAGIMAFFASLRYWELSRSSLVSMTQPLFVLPMAVLFLQQFPNRIELIGGGIILVGGFWLTALHVKMTRSAR